MPNGHDRPYLRFLLHGGVRFIGQQLDHDHLLDHRDLRTNGGSLLYARGTFRTGLCDHQLQHGNDGPDDRNFLHGGWRIGSQ